MSTNPVDNTGLNMYQQAAQSQGAPRMPELSAEEQKLMKACHDESFWYRGLPLGMAFGALTQAAIQAGKIAVAGNIGKIIRVFSAGTVGYVLGKASYTNACRQKFLQEAPNSNISRILKGEQPIPVPDAQPDPDAGQYQVSLAPGAQISEAPPYQQPQQSPLPFGQQAQYEQAIDRERQEGTLSYDQLRNQHRHRQSQPIPPPLQPQVPARPQGNDPGYYTIPDPPLPPPSSSESGFRSPAAKSGQANNKYGDEGFE